MLNIFYIEPRLGIEIGRAKLHVLYRVARVLGNDGDDFGRGRTVMPSLARPSKRVVVVMHTLAEGAEEPRDRVASLIGGLVRREYRCVLPGRLIANPAENSDVAPLDHGS